ncbi:MAG: metal ABC transporter permease [Sedimentisphaerales bacterium]|nr:metal ABC transporter permease [Sedimentisphaerales bacterium]
MDTFFVPIMITAAFAGIGIGLLGVFIVGMRMPFIGVCISHSAMVGAVYASLMNVSPTLGALLLSMVGSAGVAFVPSNRKNLDANSGQAILLSLMMGLVFLAVGLEQDSRAEILSLLWGNILFADWNTVLVTGVVTFFLGLFVLLFNKELQAILFSRSLAAATSLYTNFVYCLFLCFCGLILAINLKAVGGLLLFSLLVCPAAAAYQVCRGYKAVVIAAIGFGILSTLLGFLVSYYLNLPTGACTVIVSALIFMVSSLCRLLFHIQQ